MQLFRLVRNISMLYIYIKVCFWFMPLENSALMCNFITMTSLRARCRLKSPASRLFAQAFIQVHITENTKAPRHWPLWGEFAVDRWHKGPVTRKMFPFDDIIILKQVYAKKFCFPIMNNRHIWGICVFHIFMSAYIAWEFPDYRHCSWQHADKLPHILTNQQNKLRIITGSIAWIHRYRFGSVQIATQVKTLWHEYMFGCPRATD